MTNQPVGRKGIGSSGITSWTLNPPEYLHNQQRETSKPVVQPLPTKAKAAEAEEAPKKKRTPRKKKVATPTLEAPKDKVQEIVDADLKNRGISRPKTTKD